MIRVTFGAAAPRCGGAAVVPRRCRRPRLRRRSVLSRDPCKTDDPFVADEMSLPTLTKNPTDSTGGQSYSIEADIAKRLFSDFGVHRRLFLETTSSPRICRRKYGLRRPQHRPCSYQLFINNEHELMGLLGLDVDWGHTGAINHGGADDHTTPSRPPSTSARAMGGSAGCSHLAEADRHHRQPGHELSRPR